MKSFHSPPQNSLQIRNVGYQTHRCNTVIDRPDGRSDIHILFSLAGKIEVTTAHAVQTIHRNCYRLFVPYEAQHYEFVPHDSGPSESFWIHFDGSGAQSLLQSLSLWHNQVTSISSSEEICHLFRLMIEEYDKKLPGYATICAGILMQILALFSRYSNIPSYPAKEETIEIAFEYIHKHLNCPITVTELANTCHLSAGRFAHLFQEVTGLSPIRYVNKIRIEKAKNLLLSTSMRIGEISSMLGFRDPFYFSTLFRKTVGKTPSQYRIS